MEFLVFNDFMNVASPEVVKHITSTFIDHTGNAAMQTLVCAVCARELSVSGLWKFNIHNIPNLSCLKPVFHHRCHTLYNGMLLHSHVVLGKHNVDRQHSIWTGCINTTRMLIDFKIFSCCLHCQTFPKTMQCIQMGFLVITEWMLWNSHLTTILHFVLVCYCLALWTML